MVLVALAALGAGLLTQRTDAGSSAPAAAARVNSIGGLGGYVLGAQVSGARLWVDTCVDLCGVADTGLDSERLVELDASTGVVIRRLPVQTNMTGFTIAGGSVWVAHFLSGELTRLDPMSGSVTATVRLRLPRPVVRHNRQFLPDNLTYANGSVWASTSRGWLAQIDARTGGVVRMLRTPSENNSTVTDRYGTWVAEELDGIGFLAPGSRRLRIHPIVQAGAPLAVYNVLAGGRAVWALASADLTDTRASSVVLSIDRRSARVLHRVQVPTADSGAVAVGGALYLADLAHGHIYRVSRDGALKTFTTPRHDAWLATGSPGALWAAASVTPRHKHGQLLRISLPRG